MVKEELVSRSPVRIFMQSLNGGLKPGEMGVVAAPGGLGKTSVLVQIALDKLLRGKKVIHVSFTQRTDYVLGWYEDIFNEFIKKKNLEDADKVRGDIVKNRVLMMFGQDGMSSGQILRGIKAMIEGGGFKAEALIIDGMVFSPGDRERLSLVKEFAGELGLVVWYSCTVGGKAGELYDERGIPVVIKDYEDLFEAVVVLEPRSGCVELRVTKDREASGQPHPALRLDPRTLLILE